MAQHPGQRSEYFLQGLVPALKNKHIFVETFQQRRSLTSYASFIEPPNNKALKKNIITRVVQKQRFLFFIFPNDYENIMKLL